MGTLSQARTFGGVGSILVLLVVIPTVGWVIAIIGFVLTLIAIKYISDAVQDGSIFTNMIIAIVLAIIAVVVAAVAVFASILSFIGLGSIAPGTAPTPGLLSAVAGLLAGLAVVWIISIVSAFFLRKSYNSIATKLNVGMFRTAALIYFIGAILTIIAIGFVLMFVAEILLIIAFFSIPEAGIPVPPPSFTQPPPPPAAPSPPSQAGPVGAGKYCIKCGASLASDAAFCPNCGASQTR